MRRLERQQKRVAGNRVGSMVGDTRKAGKNWCKKETGRNEGSGQGNGLPA